MGLDMYLYRRRYVQNWDHLPPERKTEVTLSVGGKPVPLKDVVYVTEQVAYWRKANAIHKFFCDLDGGKDECQEIHVSGEALTDLVLRCETVLANHSLAEQLLPTQSGFFFGGTDYDDYYFADLEETVKVLKPLIEDTTNEGELIYQASW